MSLFTLEAPFLTQYRVYYLPSYAKTVNHIPSSEVKQEWIIENITSNKSKSYSTKKKAVKKAKKFAKRNKPAEIFVYKRKDNSFQTKHEYHGEHVFGDDLNDLRKKSF